MCATVHLRPVSSGQTGPATSKLLLSFCHLKSASSSFFPTIRNFLFPLHTSFLRSLLEYLYDPLNTEGMNSANLPFCKHPDLLYYQSTFVNCQFNVAPLLSVFKFHLLFGRIQKQARKQLLQLKLKINSGHNWAAEKGPKLQRFSFAFSIIILWAKTKSKKKRKKKKKQGEVKKVIGKAKRAS